MIYLAAGYLLISLDCTLLCGWQAVAQKLTPDDPTNNHA
jgi:hypothetical protein